MRAMEAIFLLIGLQVLFVMLVWTVVTVLRLIRPDKLLPFDTIRRHRQYHRFDRKTDALMSLAEIREQQRKLALREEEGDDYYEMGDTLPARWIQDIHKRCN